MCERCIRHARELYTFLGLRPQKAPEDAVRRASAVETNRTERRRLQRERAKALGRAVDSGHRP